MQPIRNGFTLVEVVVALAVSALVLSIVFVGLGQTLEREQRSDHALEALAIAQSEVNLRTTYSHRVGEWGGRQGDLRWRVIERSLTRDPRGSQSLDEIEAIVWDENDREVARLSRRAIRKTPDLP